MKIGFSRTAPRVVGFSRTAPVFENRLKPVDAPKVKNSIKPYGSKDRKFASAGRSRKVKVDSSRTAPQVKNRLQPDGPKIHDSRKQGGPRY